ncbi:flagellar biosynthetic protein FliR [Bordetella genomosp. 1]|uniref:Flagellar biosynthetic protein FliR n=1 Tax=Bordetella genomosp. 1 TaxID=1395607 RepID=A0A261SFL1_9BORD|nr:flagellar biosynthetic protein FliR [Bordetella genomosp. 1]OZI35133.1 flagellar biosynthetic protein FliR [Bordetella genomosp. 1]OZI63672.1 flagellar biosynthetic protein FliR [Bordetella genomosp. 1]
MIQFTEAQLTFWLSQFLWPFVRILALIGSSPLFSESAIPIKVKIGLGFALTVALMPTLGPFPTIPPGSWEGLMVLTQQILIGVAMGLTMRIVFAAVQTAGEYIGLQMGLSFASFFDPGTGANTAVLARFLNIIAMLTFLALDGHLLMLAGLVKSFQLLPIEVMSLDRNGWGILTEWGGTVFVSGLLLSLPLVCALLTLNLAMGILNRAAQQLTVFAVGFPIMLTVGLILLTIVLPHAGPFLEGMFERGLQTMSDIANGLAGR